MLSYKSATLFDERFSRNPNRNGEDPWSLDDHGGGLIGGRFDIAGYLDHQGERFIERFDANCLSGHPAHHGYLGSAERASLRQRTCLAGIRARLTFIGISSDWLFPPDSVRDFAALIRSAGVPAEYREMTSSHGHDAFLAEQAELVRLLQ